MLIPAREHQNFRCGMAEFSFTTPCRTKFLLTVRSPEQIGKMQRISKTRRIMQQGSKPKKFRCRQARLRSTDFFFLPVRIGFQVLRHRLHATGFSSVSTPMTATSASWQSSMCKESAHETLHIVIVTYHDTAQVHSWHGQQSRQERPKSQKATHLLE
jgi:hypothetical protein